MLWLSEPSIGPHDAVSQKTVFAANVSPKKTSYNYNFPIDLAPNWIPFGAKSIGEVQLESKFDIKRFRTEFSVCTSYLKVNLLISVLLQDISIENIFHQSKDYFRGTRHHANKILWVKKRLNSEVRDHIIAPKFLTKVLMF